MTSQKQLKPKNTCSQKRTLVEHNPQITCTLAGHEKEACKIHLMKHDQL